MLTLFDSAAQHRVAWHLELAGIKIYSIATLQWTVTVDVTGVVDIERPLVGARQRRLRGDNAGVTVLRIHTGDFIVGNRVQAAVDCLTNPIRSGQFTAGHSISDPVNCGGTDIGCLPNHTVHNAAREGSGAGTIARTVTGTGCGGRVVLVFSILTNRQVGSVWRRQLPVIVGHVSTQLHQRLHSLTFALGLTGSSNELQEGITGNDAEPGDEYLHRSAQRLFDQVRLRGR